MKNLTFKEIRELIREHCYALWIVRKNTERNYCAGHKKHHRYWLYPTIEFAPRPWWGFDTKKELSEFVIKEFKK